MDIIKCALQHFVMKVGCYVTDDRGNYVTFHKLNRKKRSWTVRVTVSFKAQLQPHHGSCRKHSLRWRFFLSNFSAGRPVSPRQPSNS